MRVHTVKPVERVVQVETLVSALDVPRPKGFYFPGESHDFWEAVFVYEGEVTATADERVYQLCPGKLLLHKPMEFHRIWAAKDCSPRLINLSFQARGPVMKRLENGCFDLKVEQQRELWNVVRVFTKVMELQKDRSSREYQLAVSMTASLLEVFLISLSENAEQSQLRPSANEERYGKIVQVMKANCNRNMSLRELADLCNMSVSNMKRIFAMYSDVGIAKFFLALKMRRAMELIDAGMRASQVAEELQYPEVSYFYTAFKRETGMTPEEYRKRYKHQST